MTILTTLSALLLLIQAYQDVQVADELPSLNRLWAAIMEMPVTFVFGTFTLLCAWSLTSLLLFHGIIISVAQTTNERVRAVYRFGAVENTADKGCCRNWYNAFCLPYSISRIPKDMSEVAQCVYVDEETVWDGEAHGTPAVDQPSDPSSPYNGGKGPS